MEISINLLCDIELGKIELFKMLLSEHIAFIGEDNIVPLKGIFITEDRNVASTVNTIIKSIEPNGNYSPREQNDSFAVTVPIEFNGALSCFIVMGETYLTEITPEFSHPFKVVSTLFEELLHVKIYALKWKGKGHIQHINKGIGICKADILTLVSTMMDEYLVSRMKANIFSQYSSFQQEPGTDLVGGKLSYSGNPFERIKVAENKLIKLIEELELNKISAPDVWRNITRILYRDIFEPLSRNAAFCDEYQEACNEGQLNSIKLYNDLIADYWSKIHFQLKTVDCSSLQNYESVMNSIVDVFDALLEKIGIVYSRGNGEDCWVKINPKILQLFDEKEY